MTALRECMYDCTYPAEKGKRKCHWHGLMTKPIEVQIEAAQERHRAARQAADPSLSETARIKPADWPPGERFCSGCQGFVPLFYCTGSRCKAHNALSAHSGRLVADYGITREDYLALLQLQGGVCAVCGQLPKTKRLAVDHDHKTGEVRGLLCADMERGCNKAVLGSLEARAVDSALDAVRRLAQYLMKTPYDRLKEERDVLSQRQGSELQNDDGGTGAPPPALHVPDTGDAPPAVVPAVDPLRAPAPEW